MDLIDFWNARYAEEASAYGNQPNTYFKQVIDGLPIGTCLVPAAGDGRDAIYAAQLGWTVYAFDLSEVARDNALRLASEMKVSLQYDVMSVEALIPSRQNQTSAFTKPYSAIQFDLIALCYHHMPYQLRVDFHAALIDMLSAKGGIVLEAFNPNQLGRSSGGPKDIEMLMSKESMAEELSGLSIVENSYHLVELNHGQYHVGEAEVVYFFGQRMEKP